jgi:phospho-N-acetylmuramoyl-pentapeptide-transferase
MLGLILVFFSSALTGWFVTIPVVWVLRVFRMGQAIREEGPASHKVKAGTPTMGGIGILLAILIVILILINVDLSIKYAAIIGLTFGYALLGFLDDTLKIRKKQNTGLLASEKFLGQILFSAIFAAVLIYLGYADSAGGLLKALGLDNPYLYLPFTCSVLMKR